MYDRAWAYGILTTTSALTTLIPATAVFSGGSLTDFPPTQDRFVIFRMDNSFSRLRGDDRDQAEQLNLDVWVYDKPGSYQAIDAYIRALRTAMPPEIEWAGNGAELFDDTFKRLVRTSSYALIGASV